MEITSADALLAYFENVRRRTRAVAACIPEDRVEWPPGEGRFTSGDLVRHIAATGRWLWGETVQGRPSRYPGHGPELADGKDAILDYLDRMYAETVAIIGSLTPEQLEERCETLGGSEMRVWKWLRLMIEHEIHHRGQLYSILGQLQVTTPALFGVREPEVRAMSESGPGE